jgi:hypothetical protein
VRLEKFSGVNVSDIVSTQRRINSSLTAIDLRGLTLLEINSAERPICERIQTSAGFY